VAVSTAAALSAVPSPPGIGVPVAAGGVGLVVCSAKGSVHVGTAVLAGGPTTGGVAVGEHAPATIAAITNPSTTPFRFIRIF
jgi:hypothetical protein